MPPIGLHSCINTCTTFFGIVFFVGKCMPVPGIERALLAALAEAVLPEVFKVDLASPSCTDGVRILLGGFSNVMLVGVGFGLSIVERLLHAFLDGGWR